MVASTVRAMALGAAVLAAVPGCRRGGGDRGGEGPGLPPPPVAERLWGITIDDPWRTAATVETLQALPRRVMVRVVFDEGQHADGYIEPLGAIHAEAGVMGELLDSAYVVQVTPEQYRARATEFLDALGDLVDLWEVGNEVNGEWLGATPDVVAKIQGAYDQVRARGRPTALTLYYNEGCWEDPDHEMFAWTEANLPPGLRGGLDYVLVSYYEDDCNGLQPDWPAVFRRLASLFPAARLGIGECGTTAVARKEAMMRRYYGMVIDEPRFVGGYFWWYGSQDLVPPTKPLFAVLREILQQAP